MACSHTAGNHVALDHSALDHSENSSGEQERCQGHIELYQDQESADIINLSCQTKGDGSDDSNGILALLRYEGWPSPPTAFRHFRTNVQQALRLLGPIAARSNPMRTFARIADGFAAM